MSLAFRCACLPSRNLCSADGSGPNPTGAGLPSRRAPEGYYIRDAELFASWKVDYLKFDGCSGPKSSISAMRAALNATGRSITYSINNGVQVSNRDQANLWRTTPDISNTYDSMIWTAMYNNNATKIVSGQPGAWNDADSRLRFCCMLYTLMFLLTTFLRSA